MCLDLFEFNKYLTKINLIVPLAVGAVFLLLSVVVYGVDVKHGMIIFFAGTTRLLLHRYGEDKNL